MKITWSERDGVHRLRIESGVEDGTMDERRIAILPLDLLVAKERMATLQLLPGTFEIGSDALYFAPRFPFVEGTSYAVLLDDRHVATVHRPARRTAPTARVVAVYPSAPLLPSNALRLYVHFSSPMSEGWARRAVRVLRGDTREPLDAVFLDMTPELWDRTRRRLTLLLDPGRIKRGLVPNLEAGCPLVEGQPIVVMVDAAFRDAAGSPLCDGAERRYDVGPAVRHRVDPMRWHCGRPRAGSLDPLVVEFDRPLDHAMLAHSVQVCDAAGAPVPGRSTVGTAERSWHFTPERPWERDRHRLVIEASLEDVAGNSVRRVFDRDLLRPEDDPQAGAWTEIAFICRSAAEQA